MKSISIKITIWSVAALLISLVMFAVVGSSVMGKTVGESITFFNQILLQQATSAYESGGSSQLSHYLRQLNRPNGMQFHLTDASGRDLATGEDRSALVRDTIAENRQFKRGYNNFTFAIASQDGRYLWLTSGSAPSVWLFAPFYLLLLATVAALYWLLTTNIAAPLRNLATAVDRFGKGELTARANTRSKDEVGNLGHSFNSMAERIQTLLVTERQLLQDVSHELRSPLARLTFEAEMVRKTADRDGAATRLRHEIERLSELVGTLIDMARVEGEPGTVEMEEVCLNDLLLSIVEDCNVETVNRGCTIALTLPEVVILSGNTELLRRAIENIIRNAIRYAPVGTTVEVVQQREEDAVVISVRDRGLGIPSELNERIFDPFFRVDSSREEKTGGLGLGLAIARRAVRVHHGDIVAQDANPGALLRITLPASAVIERSSASKSA